VDIAWTGSNFLVVWSTWDPPAQRLLARRISTDGQFLDSEPRSLVADAGSIVSFDLVAGSDQALLIWSKSEAEVRYARVAQDGASLDPEGRVLGPGAKPRVAWNGDHYVAVWFEDLSSYVEYEVLAARVASDGTLLDATARRLGVWPFGGLALAAGPNATLLAWTKIDGVDFECYSCEADAYVTRLGPSLEVLDPSGIPVMVTSDSDASCDVMALGNDFLVATVSDHRVHLIPLSAAGQVGPSLGRMTGARDARLTPAGSRALGLFSTDGAVLAAPIAYEGFQDLDAVAVPVSRTANRQQFPSLAADGAGEALLVWSDDRYGGMSIVGRRITSSGASPEANARRIGTSVKFGPKAARVDSDYLVVWASEGVPKGQGPVLGRFAERSVTLDLSGGGLGREPNTACSGSTCCVVWRDPTQNIRVSLVTSSGTLSPIGYDVAQLSQPVEFPTYYPAVLAMEDRFLVLWYRGAATVELDGTVNAPSRTGGVPYHRFSAASNGRVALAAWTERLDVDPTQPAPTYAMVLDADGEYLVAKKLLLESNTDGLPTDSPPTVGWDGVSFLVVVGGSVYRVSPDARVLEPLEGFAVERADTSALRALSPSTALYVGSKLDPSLGVQRLFSQTITREAGTMSTGMACDVADECETGACEDGVCCQHACGVGEVCNLESNRGQCVALGTGGEAAAIAASGGCSVTSPFEPGSAPKLLLALFGLALLLYRKRSGSDQRG
jgi:MYXO-CTERM domain-containing protein